MMVLVWVIILIASLYILSKAADYFTEASEKIGKILKLPRLVTGILIVALGTSLPELFTSIFGVINGKAGILSGNTIGSVIANILLGLGLVVVISKKIARFNWDSVSNDMPFLVGTIILLFLTINDGVFKFYEAIIFLLAYIIYVIYSLRIKKMNPKEIREDLNKEIVSQQREALAKEIKKNTPEEKTLKTVIIFIISLILVIFSAKYTVKSVISLAVIFNLGTSALAASVIAVGTSLPEISVGIAAAKKGHFDLVIGNIMGSNIFNILVVFGVIGLFTNIPIPYEIIHLILPMAGAAILIQWLVTMDKKITITEGLMMTLLYITFIAKLFKIF